MALRRKLSILTILAGFLFASEISLETAKFDPLKEGEPNIPLELRAKKDGVSLYILQFKGPIKNEWKDALKNEGIELYGYLPYYACFARMDKTKKEKVLSLSFVRWIGLYHPYYKISPEFKNLKSVQESRGTLDKERGWRRYTDPLYVSGANQTSIVLYGLPYVNWFDVSIGVNRLGGSVKQITGAAPGRMIVWIDPSKITELARIDGIYYISPYYPKTFLNNTTKYVLESDVLTVVADDWPNNTADSVTAGELPLWDHNIKGQGQLVTVFDTGVDYYSCWFRDPEGDPPGPNHIVIEDYTNEGGDLQDDSTCGHGTHVTGTVAGLVSRGGASGYDDYSGHAYLGRIYMQDIGYAGTWGCALNINNFYNSATTAYNKGSRISTHSWGYSGAGGNYANEALDIDVFTFTHPEMLFTVAAGNDGPNANTVGPPSTAKNSISVGSTYRESYDRTADSLSDFSSRGPTDDNRYKPDLTAPGGTYPDNGNWREYIMSAYPVEAGNWGTPTCYFAGMMGTSMATPAVAACAALVRQYYMEGWYPTGNPGNAFTPSGMLVKATLLVSTQDMWGVTGAIPNFDEGFGRVLLDSALYFVGDAPQRLYVEDTASLTTGEADTFLVEVLSATRPFRLALTWYDTAAAANANPTLVNNLNLRLEDPSGNWYLGNDMTNGQSNANGSTTDSRNTVEYFQLSSPATGIWRVIIQAQQVATGTAQSYAFAATGDIEPSIGIYEKSKSTVVTAHGLTLPSPSILRRGEKFHIRYSLANESFVVLKVYDVTGRVVRTIIGDKQKRGEHTLSWDGTDDKGKILPSGKYFYRLFADDIVGQKHLILIE